MTTRRHFYPDFVESWNLLWQFSTRRPFYAEFVDLAFLEHYGPLLIEKLRGRVAEGSRFAFSVLDVSSFLSIFFRGAPKCVTESVWVATARGSRDTREVPAASGRLSVGRAAAAGREGAV
jgi:hypothetical protein